MAVYKVAQDVEAEDKLLGPFSFRQFIYLIITVMGIVMAWGLAQLFIPLAIIPLPIILLFGALALPLRKDQPMETYLGALISFFLKPRKRLWVPDGTEHLIEIVAPKSDDVQLTKNLSRTEAQRRLAYLADLADTRGWSIRHSTMPVESSGSMVTDVYNEAQQTKDVLDSAGDVAQLFDNMIGKADDKRRQDAINRMRSPQQVSPAPVQPIQETQTQPAPTQAPPVTVVAPAADQQQIDYNPYPNMRQSIINPVDDNATIQPQPTTTTQTPPPVQQPKQTENPSTSVTPPSADILELANNSDLSIETIAHEAKRRSEKSNDDEVVISLR